MIPGINTVIHMVTPHLNGGLFDAFEYFAYYYSLDKNAKLYLIQSRNFMSKNYMGEEYLKDLFLDKYDLPDNIFDNVIFLKNQNSILHYRFDKVLILDNHTYHYLNGLIIANEYHIIVDPYIPSKTDYIKLSKRPNHFIYSELLLHKDELSEYINN